MIVSKRSVVRVCVLLAVVGSTASLVLLSMAGSALAATSVTCTDSASDQAALQAAINGGGVVLVHGHCLGNWTAAINVTLTGVSGAVLDGNASGSVLAVTNFSVVTVNSLTITNGSATDGGGVFADSDTTVNVNNSTIKANTASDGGGGVYAQDFAIVNLTGTSVSGNQANRGGGIYVIDGYLTATNSNVTSNTAVQGGGIASESSDVLLTSTHVNSNTAQDYAGGIASFDSGAIDQQGTAPAKQAPARGAFAWAASPSTAGAAVSTAQQRSVSIPTGMTLTNSSVDHNTAYGQGGGGIVNVAVNTDTLLNLAGTSVSYNNVPNLTPIGAGGIANVGANPNATSTLTMSGSTFKGNLARRGDGGAIYNVSQGGTTLLSIASTSISSQTGTLNPNQAALGGGIYNDATAGEASISLMKGASIVHNKASITGGGIYNRCNGDITLNPGSRARRRVLCCALVAL